MSETFDQLHAGEFDCRPRHQAIFRVLTRDGGLEQWQDYCREPLPFGMSDDDAACMATQMCNELRRREHRAVTVHVEYW